MPCDPADNPSQPPADHARVEAVGREITAGLGRYRVTAQSLTLIAWAVPGYVLRFSISIGPTDWQLGTIADILVAVAMNQLREQKTWGLSPLVTLVLAVLQLTSRVAAIFGLADHYSIEFSSLILLGILFLLLKMTGQIETIRGYRSAVIAAIATTILGFLFLIGGLFSIGAVLLAHNFLARFTPAQLLSNMLGSLVPVAAFWLVSTVLTLYAVIGIVVTIRRRALPVSGAET